MSWNLFLVALVLLSCPTAFARIGETALQCADRYGAPKDTALTKIMDKGQPLLEGAVHHVYEYQGWKLRAAFLSVDGPAVRIDYSKLGPDVQIKDYELDAIMKANTGPGDAWRQIPYSNPDLPANRLSQAIAGGVMGEKMWQRSDGAILWVRSYMIVRLELPAAREYEAKLKAAKEQKARASVSHF